MDNAADNISFCRIPPEVLVRWKLVRDVVRGDADMYLPVLNAFDQSAENTSRNAAYRQRAVWYPATEHTLDGLLGMAFRVDPTIELDSKLEHWEKDIDGAGTSIFQQAQEVLANVLGPGRHGLYTDWSDAVKGPVVKSYHAENIINWKYRNVDGEMVLTMVILEEDVEVEDGKYALKVKKQWRELVLEDNQFIVRLWEEAQTEPEKNPPTQAKMKDANGQDVDQLVIRTQTEVLDFIPFTFVGSRKNNGAEIGPSPLFGLAKMNLAHFRNSADHEDSVFYCGQAQPWMTGLTEQWRDWLVAPYIVDENGAQRYVGQRMYVGSRAPLMLPTGGQFAYASPDPNTMVKDAMMHKEAQMIAIGARLIEPGQAGSRTATEDENDKEATTSVLSMCVANVNEAYMQCIAWGMRWHGTKDYDADGDFKVTQEFIGKKIDPAVLASMVSAWQAGITAKDDVRHHMRAVGLLRSDRDDAQIEADLAKEGPKPGTIGLEDEDQDLPPIEGETEEERIAREAINAENARKRDARPPGPGTPPGRRAPPGAPPARRPPPKPR